MCGQLIDIMREKLSSSQLDRPSVNGNESRPIECNGGCGWKRNSKPATWRQNTLQHAVEQRLLVDCVDNGPVSVVRNGTADQIK